MVSHSKPFFKGETEYKTIFGYDQLQRLISKEMPGNRVYTTSYNNLTVSTLNPENQQEIKMYDSDNNLIKSIDNDNNTTNYTYDVDGRLIKTELNNNDKTSVSYSYDIFGNLIQVDDPAIGTKKFQFDCFDQITRVEHNDVIVQSDFVYDKLGRILQKNENDEGIAVWHYDKQFKGMIDNTQFTNTINGDVYLDNFVYNDYAKLSQQDHSVFHDGVHRDYAYTYTYNNAGLLNELGYPSGLKLKYNYSEGQVTTITRESDNKILWRLYKENALNQVQSEAYGNSISTSKTYYPETNLIKQIFTSQPMKFGANRDVGHKIQDFTYDWDNIGNLISRVKKLETGEILTEQFDYDNLNRLTHDFINNGANGN